MGLEYPASVEYPHLHSFLSAQFTKADQIRRERACCDEFGIDDDEPELPQWLGRTCDHCGNPIVENTCPVCKLEVV